MQTSNKYTKNISDYFNTFSQRRLILAERKVVN